MIKPTRFQPLNITLTKAGDAALLVRLACYYFTNHDKLWSGKRRNHYGICSFILSVDSWDVDRTSNAPLARYSFGYVKCAKCGRVHQITMGSIEPVISECNLCSIYKPFRPIANPICSYIVGLNDTDCDTINTYLMRQYHRQL